MPTSRKPSATNRSQSEPLTYFVDHDLGTKILPDRLRSLGATVEILSDHFNPNTRDVDWIPRIATRGWVILTHDRAITHNRLEREAVLSAGARYVCIAGANLRGVEIADLVGRHFALLSGLLSVAPTPLLVRVLQKSVQFLDRGEWTTVRIYHSRRAWWRRRGMGR